MRLLRLGPRICGDDMCGWLALKKGLDSVIIITVHKYS